MSRSSLLVFLTVAAVALAGCAGNPPAGNTTGNTTTTTTTMVTTTTQPPTNGTMPHCEPTRPHAGSGAASGEVVFTIQEPTASDPCYQLKGPASVGAGWTTVKLQNSGREPHQAALLKLDGMTFDAFAASLTGGNASTNASMDAHGMGAAPVPYGGPLAGPGATGTVVLNLAQGEYAVVCFIPGMDGVPHAFMGMVTRLNVTAPAGPAAAEPTGDVNITLKDYSFNLSANLTTGAHTIRVVNAGPHHHEAVLMKIAGNATLDQVLAAFGPNATGPPPILAMDGVAIMDANQTAYVKTSLTAGRWAILCFEQDSDAAPPHFVLGMSKEIEVA